MPDLNDHQALLSYFGLDENATIDEIRESINIQIMEFSPESLLDSSINDGMTEEEQDQHVSFLNRASVVLASWKNKNK